MSSIQLRLNVALVGVVLSTSVVATQGLARPTGAGKSKQTAAARRAPVEVKSLINGVAMDRDQKPMPKALLRLRNLAVNAIEQTVTANDRGEFSFSARPNVPYVVEVADQTGRIIAVGDVVLANAGEVAAARVAVPARVPPATVFTETASTVVSAATDAGVLVVDPALPTLSPKQ